VCCSQSRTFRAKNRAEAELLCAVYGEGTVFPVKIAVNAKVNVLQEKIAGVLSSEQHTVPPRLLTLYLARKKEGKETKWLKDDRHGKDFLRGAISTEYEEMRPSWKLSKKELFGDFQLGEEDIHVLVELPTEKTREWRAEDLSSVDLEVQLKMWKSVVRVSAEDACSGTALVVDRTETRLYLLTNLHLWVDSAFTDALSAAFKTEITRYLQLNPGMKSSSGKKRKGVAEPKQPIRKSPRTARREAPAFSDKPQVVIEQLLSDGKTLEEVLKFRLDSGVCWRCSADFDFAIFEVEAPQNVQLTRCKMSTEVYPTMHVHVFGFAGALQDHPFNHRYAIIPAEVTGLRDNQMMLSSLSAPGLSESGIVCTKRGIPVGYIGGGFDRSAGNEQYQSYG
jgi:hypothetical protein